MGTAIEESSKSDESLKCPMQQQIKFPVVCPNCGNTNMLCRADLDRLLENDEVIEEVCFTCDVKWKLDAQDKARIRNQREELKKLADRK